MVVANRATRRCGDLLFFLRRHGNADTGADGGGVKCPTLSTSYSLLRANTGTDADRSFWANGADFVATTGK